MYTAWHLAVIQLSTVTAVHPLHLHCDSSVHPLHLFLLPTSTLTGVVRKSPWPLQELSGHTCPGNLKTPCIVSDMSHIDPLPPGCSPSYCGVARASPHLAPLGEVTTATGHWGGGLDGRGQARGAEWWGEVGGRGGKGLNYTHNKNIFYFFFIFFF